MMLEIQGLEERLPVRTDREWRHVLPASMIGSSNALIESSGLLSALVLASDL